jgi:hypothetical protein
LKSCVGHWRALITTLDHRKQQVSVGVTLWSVQYIVKAAHGGGDTHRANVWGTFVCPER